jgi:hypothetical protein
MARQRTLYQQLEHGLGMSVAEARAITDSHLLWRGGRTPELQYHGRTFSVTKLLKFNAPDSKCGDEPLTLRDRRIFQLCEVEHCCAPNHYGSRRSAGIAKLPEEVKELITEITEGGVLPGDVTSLDSLRDRVNPFYERQVYEAAIGSGLLVGYRHLLKLESEREPEARKENDARRVHRVDAAPIGAGT